MTALTRDDIQTDNEMLLYIERCIAGAYNNVGKHRTDRADIARILLEHGAHSSQAHIALDQYLRRRLPAPALDEQRIASINQRIQDIEAAGYTQAELNKATQYDKPRRGGMWDELRHAMHEHDDAILASSAHETTIEKMKADWWASHKAMLLALCDKHAGWLLKARQSFDA